MTPEALQKILDDHRAWLGDPSTGKRANLFRANLSRADLSDADLFRANLSRADLSDADLFRANLSRADLSDADLFRANLSRADLSDADLFRANLSRADLSDADLPYPVHQFFLGRFNAVATPTELRIGCEVHPWIVWLDDKQRKKIAHSARFTEQEYETHSKVIKFFHELLQPKEKVTP